MARRAKRADEERLARQQWLGSRLRAAREDAGYTQREVGEWIAVGSNAISDIERGLNSIDSHDLTVIARRLGYPVEWFTDPNYRPRLPRPSTRLDWESLYPEAPQRARLHYELERTFDENAGPRALLSVAN